MIAPLFLLLTKLTILAETPDGFMRRSVVPRIETQWEYQAPRTFAFGAHSIILPSSETPIAVYENDGPIKCLVPQLECDAAIERLERYIESDGKHK